MATIMTLGVEKMKKGSAADGFGSGSSFGDGLLLLDSLLMKKKKNAAYNASVEDSDDSEDNHHKREADILFNAIMKDLFGLSVMSEQEREKKKKKKPAVKDNIPSRGREGVSIKEDDEGMTVKVEMPGLGKENVKVSVVDYTLLIKEDLNETDENGKKKKNNKWGMHLPDEYKYEEIKATMKNGILTVVIPKKKEEERKEDGIHVVVED